MPDLSNVISTSIVAVGASLPLHVMGLERFGAKAEERQLGDFGLVPRSRHTVREVAVVGYE